MASKNKKCNKYMENETSPILIKYFDGMLLNLRMLDNLIARIPNATADMIG